MKTKEELKTLRVHANRNARDILDSLGIAYSQRGPLLQAKCACAHHAGDGNNSTAFSWRLDYGRWVCFTHHCERGYGNDVFGLVRSVKEITFGAAVKWVEASLDGVDLDAEVSDSERTAKRPKLHIHEPISEERLKFLKQDHTYLNSRGFRTDVLEQYNVGVWRRIGTYMNNRVVFPVRDHQGFVIGFTGRTLLTPEQIREQEEKTGRKVGKWIHGRDYVIFPNKDKQELFITSVLFNWHRAKRRLGVDKELIVVEGPLDGMRLEEAGIQNWVATFGTTFTPIQRSLLVDAGVNKLRCAYDSDVLPDGRRPGDDGWELLTEIVGNLMDLERVQIPAGKDPGGMTVNEVRQVFAYETKID
jgi:DNA primase